MVTCVGSGKERRDDMRVQGWAGIDTIEEALGGERNVNANADIDVWVSKR